MDQILRERAAELVEQQRTVHERVACPVCLAPIGSPCVRARNARTKYASRIDAYDPTRAPLKHSHAARLQADGITLR